MAPTENLSMKIGILMCGDVPDTLKNTFGEYSQCLLEQFGLVNNNDVQIWHAYKGEIPEPYEQCDVYIFSGSPASVNDEIDWISKLIQLVQSAFMQGKKLFGICFGHQLIHYALGGKVERSANGWGLGVHSASIHKNYCGLKQGQKVSLFSMHRDQVIKPASRFNIIAGNDFCPHYITSYQDQVFTIQAHPEFSAEFFLTLLLDRQEKFNGLAVNQAIKSSTDIVDNTAINLLISRFILGDLSFSRREN